MRRGLLLALLLVLAGCGGSGGGGSSSASNDASGVVPKNALAYVSIDTDFSSAQLKSATDVVDKFPIKDRALAQLKRSITQSGVDVDAVKNSVGPVVDVAVLNVNGEYGYVGFTQPKDEPAFDAQLDKGTDPTLHSKVSDWTVFADKQQFIDAVKNREGDLTEVPAYSAAMDTLPGETIARAYISPGAIHQAISLSGTGQSIPLNAKGTQWAAAALTSADGAMKLEVHAKGLADTSAQRTSELAGQIPSGSIVALDLVGGGSSLTGGSPQALKQAGSFIGIDLQGIVDALGSDTIAYVKAGLPIPEVTVASKPKDVRRSLKAVGALIEKFMPPSGTVTKVEVDGVELTKADLGSFAIFYGAFGDELVVSDSQNAVSELRAKGDKLIHDDSVFSQAKDGAGLPDASQGFLYVNLKDAVPAAEGLAQLANEKIPPEVEDNLRPLRSLLVYGSRDGDLQSLVAFVQTS